MANTQDKNSQILQKLSLQNKNQNQHENLGLQHKTPQKRKQFIKYDEVFNHLSPFPLPPKFNNQHTAISQSYNAFSNDMKVIQTPYNAHSLHNRGSDMEDINDELRPITSKINWEPSPCKSQNSSNQYESQQQSGSHSSVIPQQYSSKQECSDEPCSQNPEKNASSESQHFRIKLPIRSQIHKNKQRRSSGLKKSANTISIPEPNSSQNKKVFCNCKKTKCLKLYCDCFRINQTCQGCNCVGCHNLQEYAQQRNTAILVLMDRNPDPFSQKIQADKHLKGCNCKKSFCLKKYCQCYQASLKCGQNCKCDQCKNGGGSEKRERDRLIQEKMMQKREGVGMGNGNSMNMGNNMAYNMNHMSNNNMSMNNFNNNSFNTNFTNNNNMNMIRMISQREQSESQM